MNSKMRQYCVLPPIPPGERSLVGNLKPTPPIQPRRSMAMTDGKETGQINTNIDLTFRRLQMKEGETLRQKVQCRNFQGRLIEMNEQDQLLREEREKYLYRREIAERTREELRFIGIPEKYLRDPMPYPKPRPDLFLPSDNLSGFELKLPPIPSISRTSTGRSCSRRAEQSYNFLPPISSASRSRRL